jgi:predicted nuclease of predicted toxin-antitoxin system
LKFVVDNQLPVALARFLTALGHDCVHVLDVDLAQASDAEIWKFACEHHMAVVSKDADFLHLIDRTDTAASLVWVRLGNCSKDRLLAAAGELWSDVVRSLEDGESVVEIRQRAK